jgi:transposase
MTDKKKSFTDEFKEGVVKYAADHPDEPLTSVAKKFGVSDSTIHAWRRQFNANDGAINSRGSGNYSSEMEKENAKLKKELKDAKDALEVLKKAIRIVGS